MATTLHAQDVYPSRVEPQPHLLDRQDPVVYGDGAPPAPLTVQDVNHYASQGFLAKQQLFAPEEVRELLEEIARLGTLHDLKESEESITEPDTDIVRSIVLEYGMGETLGPLTFPRRRSAFLDTGAAFPDGGRDYSEATAEAVDAEMKRIMAERMQRVTELIRDKRALLDRIAAILLEREVLEAEEFQRLVAESSQPQNGEKPAAA